MIREFPSQGNFATSATMAYYRTITLLFSYFHSYDFYFFLPKREPASAHSNQAWEPLVVVPHSLRSKFTIGRKSVDQYKFFPPPSFKDQAPRLPMLRLPVVPLSFIKWNHVIDNYDTRWAPEWLLIIAAPGLSWLCRCLGTRNYRPRCLAGPRYYVVSPFFGSASK